MLWSLLKSRWHFAALNLAANILSAVFEGSTFALLAVALQVLASGNLGNSSLLGPAAQWLERFVGAHGKEPVFLGLVLLAVTAQLFRSLFQYLSEQISIRLRTEVRAEAHTAVYAKILRMPFPIVSKRKLGDLSNYLQLTDLLEDLIGRISEVVHSALMIAAYAVLLLWISWPMTLMAAAGYAVLSRLFRSLLRRVHAHSNSLLDVSIRMNEKTVEFLQAIRLLHSFSRQEESIRTVRELNDSSVRHRRDALRLFNRIEPATDLFTVLAAAVFLIGGYAVVGRQGSGGLPVLLAFLTTLYRVAPRLKMLHAHLTTLTTLAPSLERLREILSEKEDTREDEARQRFVRLASGIRMERVSLRYLPEEPAALTELTMEIPRGGFTALVGVSGAGKSSVADLLLRLYEPTSGRITADGRDLREFSRASWRDRIGVVSQDSFLFHASIRENIAFGRPEASPAEIVEAAKAAYAHGFIEKLSAGYETVAGDRGYRLSGGQCQRIALARALLRKPDLLVLDEATSALDSESERLIQRALLDQRGVRTLFVIAHRLSTVSHADRIYILSEGGLAEQGTHAELLARDGIYAKLWRLQSENGITVPIAEEKIA